MTARQHNFAMSEQDARRLRGWARTHEVWDDEPWSEADRMLLNRLDAWIERRAEEYDELASEARQAQWEDEDLPRGRRGVGGIF